MISSSLSVNSEVPVRLNRPDLESWTEETAVMLGCGTLPPFRYLCRTWDRFPAGPPRGREGGRAWHGFSAARPPWMHLAWKGILQAAKVDGKEGFHMFDSN